MGREVNIRIRQGDHGEATVEVGLPREEQAGPGLPPAGWLVLSPLTARVVRLLCASGWLSREDIASKLGENPDGKLRELLTDLAERHVLESSNKRGYHLMIPDSANPDAFRGTVLDWLNSQRGEDSAE
jgi:hypothetical protein